MSLFHNFKTQEIRLCNPLSIWIRNMIGFGIFLVTCQGAAQFSSDVTKQLNQAIADGDFHAVSLAMSGRESSARSAPDSQKLPFIKDAIHFAAVILAKCDPSLHSSFDIGPEPPFDWQKYGVKPLFNGVSPETIEDPVAREAYKNALSDHRKLMVRVSAERQKLEEGDYCARAAFRVVESSTNRKTLTEAVAKHIESLQDAQWIKDRLTQIVLPKLQTNEQTPPQNDTTTPAPAAQPPSGAIRPPLSLLQSSAPKQATSTPWSIIIILMAAATGLLWLLLKRRS